MRPWNALGVQPRQRHWSGWFYDAIQRPLALDFYPVGAAHGSNWTYGFNPAGQIGSVSRDNDAFAWRRHYAVNRPYATNGLNQYTAAGLANFAYDPNGNLIADGTNTYGYDVENRMVLGPNGAALSYDPLGRLFQVTGPAPGLNTTRFLYDGDALVVEYDPGSGSGTGGEGTMLRRHLHWPGADRPVATWEGAGFDPRQLHADERGSIVALDNAAGVPTINSYDEWGIPGAGNVGRFQYTGQIWLPELGMYYYKARIYSPTLGRFMQTDPIGYADQFNLYAYVGNDPVNSTDPSGTYECAGSPQDCNKIAGYANDLRRAARTSSQSTGSRIPSSYGRALTALSNTLGERDNANGVTVVSADLPDRVMGDHGPGPNGTTIIQLDIPNIERSRGSTGAGTLAHETTHGAQERASGQPRSLRDIFDRETVANGMESLTNQFLDQESSVWSRTMSPQERIRRIRGAALVSCDYARQYYRNRFRGQSCPR